MVKITTSDVKKWSILLIDGKLVKVSETSHNHTWRWWAVDTYKVKDIVTWKTNMYTYNSWAVLEQAEIATQNAVYLYNSGDTYSFMETRGGTLSSFQCLDISVTWCIVTSEGGHHRIRRM